MRFICEDCGQEYEDKQPSANVEKTSTLAIAARHSRGPHFAKHACARERDDEPGSLFDPR